MDGLAGLAWLVAGLALAGQALGGLAGLAWLVWLARLAGPGLAYLIGRLLIWKAWPRLAVLAGLAVQDGKSCKYVFCAGPWCHGGHKTL